MEKVSKRLLDIINKTEPVFIEVIETIDKHNYSDLNTIWTYFLKKKKNLINSDLDTYFIKYPLIKLLFEAHIKCKNEHVILFYCREENENILIQFKIENEFHHFIFTSKALIDICQKLVDNNSNQVGIIVWVNN